MRERGGNKELSLLDIAPHLPIYQAKERDFQHLLLKEMEGEEDGEEARGSCCFHERAIKAICSLSDHAHLPKRHERKREGIF